jgi:protein SYS1
MSSVIFLLVFVSRSKLIPDFALTIHFIHLIVVFLYTHSLPMNLLWWTLQITSSALMTFTGIWACQRRELAPITFGLGLGLGGGAGEGGSGESSTPAESSTAHSDAQGDEDLESGLPGFSRGRGRGRNRDGGGEFEMEPLKEQTT